ncbi:hypothetical protein [Natronobacterium gregoryi]|uniref:DUF456 domain-containing protein n=2 Tax=Natronobacterium gregoryi TaxID=44930 RepID=L0AJT6_NATGS|nr:hypothetical protein [Natronobacterium gregoryi]AFZ74138.1 hypothetical protein Natgr_3004 [Natronobacterium gregoryi SP2]ELY63874.1 hypothetical protein C490_15112 [Natronobacterium gregoryi SP2]PLK22068.1 hypothetical protein CYV19_01360 [Natronobacterium gregoryi SP2]SFI50158.1 hypothetical protein SAMN05443661_10124 [Natronobacterium gregoryi]
MSDRSWRRFSLAGFVVALVAMAVGAAAGLALVPVAGSFVGLFVGGFVTGMAVENRPLLETAIAAALATLGVLAAGAGIGNEIVTAVAVLGVVDPATLLVSIVLAAAVGAFGAHFGDDLRDGLTEPVEEADARVRSSDSPSSPVAGSSASHAADAADEHEHGHERVADEPQNSADSRDDVEVDRN